MDEIHELAKKRGVHVSYDIVNNLTNHNKNRVLRGEMEIVTYSIFVDTAKGEEIDMQAFSNLEKGLDWGVVRAKEYLMEVLCENSN